MSKNAAKLYLLLLVLIGVTFTPVDILQDFVSFFGVISVVLSAAYAIGILGKEKVS